MLLLVNCVLNNLVGKEICNKTEFDLLEWGWIKKREGWEGSYLISFLAYK